MLLLGRESISAPELARRFEVSARTIYRDIESLCEAGIPIVAYPGAGGGYGIMGDFKLDRGIMRPEEIGQLTATLASLSSALGDPKMRQTADTLKALASKHGPAYATSKGRKATGKGGHGAVLAENYLFIELAPAARDREKIGRLRRAIEERRLVRFAYVDAEGRTSGRQVEPMAIVFIWQAWYVYAWCRTREDFRLFKIARITELSARDERFEPRAIDLDERPWNKAWADSSPFLPVSIRFAEGARVEEHFDAKDIEREPDGGALVRTNLPVDEWVVSYLLGLGIPFKVLEPESLRRLVADRASAILVKNGS